MYTARFRFAVLAMLLPLAGWAPSARSATISPDDLVREVLAASRALQGADQDVLAAGARREQADAGRLPTLSLDARYARYAGLEAVSVGPALTIPELPDRYGAGATLSQPLYTGGRVERARAAAGRDLVSLRQRREAVRAQVALDATRLYWEWSKACGARASAEAAVARMDRHVADVAAGLDAGTVTEQESLATVVARDRARLERTQAASRVDLVRAAIEHRLGAPLAADAAPLAPPAGLARDVAPGGDRVGTALSNRPERAAARAQVEAAAERREAVRAGNRPTLAVQARGEVGNPNPLFFPPEDRWDSDAFVGLAATWTILDGHLTRAQLVEATARLTQARLQAAQLDDDLRREVREAEIAWADALARVPVAAHAVTSATRSLQSATDQWQNGVARHADVLDAEAALRLAQYDDVSARADLAAALAALRYAVGRLPLPDTAPPAPEAPSP